MTIQRLGGVVVSDDDARTLLDALTVFRSVLLRQGSRPTAKLDSLHARLVAAVGDSETGAGARVPDGRGGSAASFAHELLDSDAAAQLLGCTAANVRDLARRGALPGRRVGGRWVFPVRAVVDRAAARGN